VHQLDGYTALDGTQGRTCLEQPEFSTARLLVRRWRASDLEAFFAIYGDAQAMRWVGDGSPISREDCVRWMDVTRTNYEKRGYGMFAVEELASPGVIGFCGIVHPGGQAEPEVKYALLRSCWGRGFATEIASALIEYAYRVHQLHMLIATVAPANLASQNVLLKAGMQRTGLRANADGSTTQMFLSSRGPESSEGSSPDDPSV
jgi:RimJ/RimL family protein N-acetyltransferase